MRALPHTIPLIDASIAPCAHSEGCEFHALPAFMRDAKRIWGHVPVTQIQLEIHVSPRAGGNFKYSRQLVKSYGEHGLRKVMRNDKEWNNPQSVKEDRKARALLSSLLEHGFVPFHVHFTEGPTLCCATEYSLINMFAPATRLRAFGLNVKR